MRWTKSVCRPHAERVAALGAGLVAGLVALTAARVVGQPFVDCTAMVPGLGSEGAGGAAAWGDVNSDGWPDLFCSGTLFINQQGRSFKAVAVPGSGSGLIADLDNDGRGDVVSYAPLAVFRNTTSDAAGLATFESLPLPTTPPTVCLAASVADFNNDGWPDVYIAGYEDWERQITHPSFVLVSDRGRSFAVGTISAQRRSRGVTACDADENGTQDLYVSNYRLQPNQLLIGDGKGNLTDEAARRGVLATSPGFEGGHSIGACWGDFDNDGHIDLFAGNFAHVDTRGDQPKSRFLRNLGPHADAAKAWTFEDLHECGVWYQESYASPAAADYDNDGRLDLFFTTVYADASFGKKNYPVLYHNEIAGPAWAFKDATEGSGLEKLAPTYQAAWADFDRDGRIDLVTAGKLFRNSPTRTPADATTSHWLELHLKGHASSTVVGAQARVTLPNGSVLTRQIECGTGQGNANSPILHFGLGAAALAATGPLKVDVRWPGGRITSHTVSPGRATVIEASQP